MKILKYLSPFIGAFLLPFLAQGADCARVTGPYSEGDILYAADYESEQNNQITCINLRAETGGDTFTGNLNLHSGADLNIYSDSGSTPEFLVDGATGNVTLNGTLSGTYTLGGTPTLSGTFAGTPTYSGLATFSDGITIPTTERINLNAGGTSYIHEASANNVEVVTNSVPRLTITNNEVQAEFDLWINSTRRFYLDGGGNTSIRESAADTIAMEVGGGDALLINPNAITVGNGVGLALPAIDPPTANQANRNGIAKAWIFMPATGTTPTSDYNISSVSHTNGTGQYTINFDTDFASTTFVAVATLNGGAAGMVSATASSAGAVFVDTRDGAGTLSDRSFYLVVFGTQ